MDEAETIVDYVLVYSDKAAGSHNEVEKTELRESFIEHLQKVGQLEIVSRPVVETGNSKRAYVLIRAPFETLCREAERTCLKMPLDIKALPITSLWSCERTIDKCFSTDEEAVDFYAEPFEWAQRENFKDFNKPRIFFRQSLRSLLTYNILVGLDAHREETEKHHLKEKTLLQEAEDSRRRGLLFMLKHGIFSDAFPLHDRPEAWQELFGKGSIADMDQACGKTEKELLYERWTKLCSYLPLWSIRNYLGERVAFYYAWVGLLILSLWIPLIPGVLLFAYGIYRSMFSTNVASLPASNSSSVNVANTQFSFNLQALMEACDNETTPLYALIVCVWGTIFMEMWKRRAVSLATEWDVETFDEDEPDRPDFCGTEIPSPVNPAETIGYYPLHMKALRYFLSAIVSLKVVAVVASITLVVTFIRVYLTVNFCPTATPLMCFLVSTTLPAVINVAIIVVLSEVNKRIAIIMTNFENHQKQNQYNNALIIKMFAFEFINNYATCFYIAFYIKNQTTVGLFGLDVKYHDSCANNNCMSLLTMQLLVLLLVKPFYKILLGFFIPWCKRSCVKKHNTSSEMTWEGFLEQQWRCSAPDSFSNDPILTNFLDKIIIFGILMLFAASSPLAPLIVLVTMTIDVRVDSYKVLNLQRRPIAFIAQDIGMWYVILDFINVTALVTNAFLITFTSRWGNQQDMVTKLWVVIIFLTAVFVLKFLASWLIPDVPYETKLAKARERYYIRQFHLNHERKKTNSKPIIE